VDGVRGGEWRAEGRMKRICWGGGGGLVGGGKGGGSKGEDGGGGEVD